MSRPFQIDSRRVLACSQVGTSMRLFVVFALAAAALAAPLRVFAAPPAGTKKTPAAEQKQRFVRVEHDKAGKSLGLQTAVVSYAGASVGGQPIQVDLVGAVHVADKAYYELLNKTFTEYDSVLYELVAPAGTKVDKNRQRSSHPVSMLQDGMKDMLQLEHQLDLVDYAPQNFVHADMSPADLAKAMKARNESLWTILLRVIQSSMNKQAAAPSSEFNEIDLLAAMFDPKGSIVLKKILAEQFQDLETLSSVFEGPKGSSIITDRNQVALAVLKDQIAAGKRRIAIFYGAAHMPDIAKHLVADFGLHPTGERWLTAWNLK